MMPEKIAAGSPFPQMRVNSLDAEDVDITLCEPGTDWKMVVVYRGQHCPLCTRYLNKLATKRDELREAGVDVVAVTADSAEQLQAHCEKLDVNFALHYGLTVAQMKALGLYISHPRSPEETDHPFPEPGLFIINEEGNVQVVDISNGPFVRPDLDVLVPAMARIRAKDYPIRGTYEY
tara:strand:+ start:737 stop:1267 length:531 start_codon:yes stop_codon:yes gene_type:complete